MPDVQTEHMPLVRATITLIFPNLGAAVINEHLGGLVAEAMECGARETCVEICPEDEYDDDPD